MIKVIAAFNMTLDGICDHTTGIPSQGLHQHYSDLLEHGGIILYGRTTFGLMQFWPTLLQNPSGKKSMDDFAVAIDKIPKLVFSNTLKNTNWDTAGLSDKPLSDKVRELKTQPGKNILIGSRSLIIQLLNHGLVDEFQICVHPVIEGKGLRLFEEIGGQVQLKLVWTKVLDSGAVVLGYGVVTD